MFVARGCCERSFFQFLKIDDLPAPRSFITRILVEQLGNVFFYNCISGIFISPPPCKSSVPRNGYFAKNKAFEQDHYEKAEL